MMDEKNSNNGHSGHSDENNQNSQSNLSNLSNQNNQSGQSGQSNPSNQTSPTSPTTQPPHTFLPQHGHYRNLRVYQVTEIIYDITYYFAHRFLSKSDRTIDQMVQGARSGKQNIVEGFADGVSSTEMEIKLLNVARGSIKELKEDYEDYLTTRKLCKWGDHHPRFAPMLEYCRQHNNQEDYSDMYYKATDEELANIALTLCRQVDKMMTTYLEQLEKTFIEEGGIKERMTAARLGRRQTQNETIEAQAHEIEQLKERIKQLEEELMRYKSQG